MGSSFRGLLRVASFRPYTSKQVGDTGPAEWARRSNSRAFGSSFSGACGTGWPMHCNSLYEAMSRDCWQFETTPLWILLAQIKLSRWVKLSTFTLSLPFSFLCVAGTVCLSQLKEGGGEGPKKDDSKNFWVSSLYVYSKHSSSEVGQVKWYKTDSYQPGCCTLLDTFETCSASFLTFLIYITLSKPWGFKHACNSVVITAWSGAEIPAQGQL